MTFPTSLYKIILGEGMKKKLKVKSQVWYVVIILIVLLIGGRYAYQKYQEMEYQKTNEYKLTTIGYTKKEAQTLIKKLSTKDITYLLELEEADEVIVNLLKEKYFIPQYFTKYYEYYLKEKEEDLTKVVATINTNTDQEYYSLDLKTDMSKGDAILVNKYYRLEADYTPDDLVSVSMDYAWGDYGSIKVRQVVYDNFLNMWQEAQNSGFYLMINSAFRSYAEQEEVYNNYKESYGENYANSIAAKPGYSEHQTGLSIDVFSKTNSNRNTFKDSEAAKWLANNAHRFGFILRYPEDKVDLTGYNYESWHFRYVGTDIATYIYENKITFDEYYKFFLEK